MSLCIATQGRKEAESSTNLWVKMEIFRRQSDMPIQKNNSSSFPITTYEPRVIDFCLGLQYQFSIPSYGVGLKYYQKSSWLLP